MRRLYKFVLKTQKYLHLFPRDVCVITGCPRSGNTAMLNWLAQSNQTVTLDEEKICKAAARFLKLTYNVKRLYENRYLIENLLRDLIYKYVSEQRFVWNKLIIYKEPLSLHDVGFFENMERLFPRIKIIFMVRHPVNVINSMRKRRWRVTVRNVEPREMSLANGIALWKFSASQYVKNRQRNMYLCYYEKLIKDTNLESEKIKEFLGIKKLGVFVVEEAKRVDLAEDIVQKILNETQEERKLFGYS